MRKLIANIFVTLDGVMQAPGGPEEDPSGGFDYGGWSFNYWDEIMGQTMSDFLSQPFELLLGRKTYEIFAAHWPFIKDDLVADKFNNINKYVVSKSLHSLKWNKSFLINKNVVDEIKKLKATDGAELQVHGSIKLLQTLIKNTLINEFRIWTFPVTTGSGRRLFDEGTIPSSFRLINSKVSNSGVLISTYKPDGELKIGSFALINPTEEELIRRKKLSEENIINNK